MAERIHLFPYRTQKLSFLTPKVLALKRWEDRSLPLFKKQPVCLSHGLVFYLKQITRARSEEIGGRYALNEEKTIICLTKD